MDILELLEESGLRPAKKSATQGGEYCSPCPFCKDGDDRFLIWPKRPNKDGSFQGGRFSCRVCGKYGDAINFLRSLHGMTYKEACSHLKLDPKIRVEHQEPSKAKALPVAKDPPSLWQQKALAFIDWSHNQLMRNPQAKQQIIRRGFTEESIKRFKIGFNPGNEKGWDFYRDRTEWGLEEQLKEDGKPRKLWLPIGFTIPTFSSDGHVSKVKVRRSGWKEGDTKPKYVEVSGSKQSPSVYGDTARGVACIQESEFDSLLLQQIAADLVFCIALGGSTKPLDFHTDLLLKDTPIILFCPDFDQSGAVAWTRWKKAFPQARRLLTPSEKSAGDAFIEGVDLREWILEELKLNNLEK